MNIEEVGYLGLDATDISEWRRFASEFIGFEVRPQPNQALGLRMDEFAWRLLVQPANRNGVGFIGLKLAHEGALAQAREELRAAGHQPMDSTEQERRERQVQHMFWVKDPDGNRVEFFTGRATDPSPVNFARPIGGFRTGELGFGHVVMVTPQLEAMEAFYLGVIGFRLTDYFEKDIQVRFTRVNARHHSLALARGPSAFLHHIMVEYRYMDDVGRLYDQALTVPGLIQTTLGRHDNDHMLSFYSKSPGGFLVETGWGGREVDDGAWQAHEVWCMSLWGHVRHWDTPDNRDKQMAQKARAASLGLLAPVQVNDAGGFAQAATPH